MRFGTAWAHVGMDEHGAGYPVFIPGRAHADMAERVLSVNGDSTVLS